ncbi:Rpn family recombination-promoting nuclease/putative transposase [Gloeocapsopsis sp. IPPAS B-1203]|uniref:Rpn family recombination-promoting nuclease/putative transposase n=1 Tax=Gloeocapsopsis sp. IPPAS B-1203 TaxID=2049454 RepID=UPI000C1A7783|nr:Rpn family recombination-promoting nuclease/putative transposase [Gloeocapsopsis sp. IPPAS B-1203]PIG91380.1 hypothetical protein CSQ79_22095 [Gloeocapsopsis sp. IPPAS B-1203]
MRTDSLFYQLFQIYPTILFELIDNLSPRASTYSFLSQEVKQTSFRIDGILLPPPYATDLPIYFVEFQGYRDLNGDLYPSFFSEIFLYLNDYRPANDWRGILIFTRRRLDPGLPIHYQDFASSPRLQRIYLDQLRGEVADISFGLGLLQLIGVKEDAAPETARQIIEKAQRELTDATEQQKNLELVETVIIYKFPELTSEEVEQMLGLSELKQTRVYQEALEEGLEQGLEQGLERGRQEGKLAAVPLLLEAGMTVEQITERLGIDLEAVRRVAQQ